MKLSNVSRMFNRDKVHDAYTDGFLFMGHTIPHDDRTASSTARRRTLVVAPGTPPPARRAIRWYSTFWIMGDDNADSFAGIEMRSSWALKKSTGIMELITPGQASTSIAGIQLHVHKEYYRDMTDAMTSADYDIMWNVYCALTEPVAKGMFLREGNTLLRVRSTYESTDFFLVAEADEFDADAFQQAVFTQGGGLDFDPAGAAASTTSAMVIQTDVQKYYAFRNEAEAGNKPGDRTVFVAKSAVTPVVGGHLAMMGASWRVVLVVSEGDSWAFRARMGV